MSTSVDPGLGVRVRTSAFTLTLLTAILAAAYALRLYRLDFQSLWWDEGISLYLATLPVSDLIWNKDFGIDLHPPAYHLLLSWWTALAGASAFSARYLSLAAGVLVVPTTYRIGRALAGDGAGIVAASLAAVSQFGVFYSQEIRMYSLLPMLALTSIWLSMRALDSDRKSPRLWVGLGIVNVLGLYTYYYFVLLLLAETVAALVVLAPSAIGAGREGRSADDSERRRVLAVWLATQVATAALFVPWLIKLIPVFSSGVAMYIPEESVVQSSLQGFLKDCLVSYAVGFNRVAPFASIQIGLVLGLAAIGVLSTPARRAAWWTLLSSVVVPLAGAYAIFAQRPFFYPRFVGWCAPLLYVLVGAGVAWAGGRVIRNWSRPRGAVTIARAGLAAVAAITLVVLAAPTLASHYGQIRTAYSTSDYRIVLETMKQYTRPGDVAVGTYPWQLGYVAAYMPRSEVTLSYIPGQPSQSEIDRINATGAGTWLLLYSADKRWQPNVIEEALTKTTPTALVDQYGDSRVRLFGESRPISTPIAHLGEAISLLKADLEPKATLRPGSRVDLTLVWSASKQPASDFTVFTHLVGVDGRVHGQQDSAPVGGAMPTSRWSAGEVVVDRYALTLSPDVPAGEYLAEIGMYDPRTGARLAVNRSPDEVDRVVVERLQVVR